MTEEKQKEIRADRMDEYNETAAKFEHSLSEINRIGQNFKSLGTLLLEKPDTVTLESATFVADAAALPKLLEEYKVLALHKTSLQADLERLGFWPRQ